MAASLIQHHIERAHVIVIPQTRGVNVCRGGGGDIYGVLPVSAEISGVSDEWVPVKGTQLGETQREFYVPVLEGKNRDPIGGPNNSLTVQPQWYAHAGGAVAEEQTDIYMQ